MKNMLVIGGSSGIGEALVEKLSANSDKNIFASYCTNKKENTDETVRYHYLNVLEEAINLDFLPDEIHGLAYCPGSINLKPFHRISPADFESDFALQVSGAVKVIQTVLSRLKRAESASIVLFSTVAVQQGFNFHSQVAASKGAIEGLTIALSAELAPSIRVNCIAPSLTDTPLASKLLSSDEKRESNALRHPLKRIGTPHDVAAIASFLLSDASSWMTGQILHVDGGMSSVRG